MASHTSKKLRVLLIPCFTTSHIQPFTELAIRLAAANGAVEATVAVTPASEWIVQQMIEQQQLNNTGGGGGGDAGVTVKIATYPFPRVEGIPEGMENCGKATTPEETSRIVDASMSEALLRPLQETLVRAESPDAIITDTTYMWLMGIADELGMPCVVFSVLSTFTILAMNHLGDVARSIEDLADNDSVLVPGFGGHHEIRIPKRELPDHMRVQYYSSKTKHFFLSLQADCFGFALNTSSVLEKEYCEMYVKEGYAKRAYFLGPPIIRPSIGSRASAGVGKDSHYLMDWLDSKPHHSVVYVSFGSMAHVKDAQLDELALGLETSGQPFLWVVRGNDKWSPPKGWEKRVRDQDLGFIIRSWAPQKAILGHRALGAFVMQCGWNSIQETVAAGVPVLTWPYSSDQFITERLLTDVLRIGERLWPEGAGVRSGRYDEHDIIPRHDVARSLTKFMCPGGTGDAARTKVKDLLAAAAAMEEETGGGGGSSHRDLHRLVEDLLMAAKSSKSTT